MPKSVVTFDKGSSSSSSSSTSTAAPMLPPGQPCIPARGAAVPKLSTLELAALSIGHTTKKGIISASPRRTDSWMVKEDKLRTGSPWRSSSSSIAPVEVITTLLLRSSPTSSSSSLAQQQAGLLNTDTQQPTASSTHRQHRLTIPETPSRRATSPRSRSTSPAAQQRSPRSPHDEPKTPPSFTSPRSGGRKIAGQGGRGGGGASIPTPASLIAASLANASMSNNYNNSYNTNTTTTNYNNTLPALSLMMGISSIAAEETARRIHSLLDAVMMTGENIDDRYNSNSSKNSSDKNEEKIATAAHGTANMDNINNFKSEKNIETHSFSLVHIPPPPISPPPPLKAPTTTTATTAVKPTTITSSSSSSSSSSTTSPSPTNSTATTSSNSNDNNHFAREFEKQQLTKQCEEVTKKYTQAMTLNSQLKTQLEEMKSTSIVLESKVNDLSTLVEQLKQQQQQPVLQQQAAGADDAAQRRALQVEIEQLKIQLTDAQHHTASVSSSASAATETLKSTLQHKDQENAQLREQVAEEQATNKDLNTHIEELILAKKEALEAASLTSTQLKALQEEVQLLKMKQPSQTTLSLPEPPQSSATLPGVPAVVASASSSSTSSPARVVTPPKPSTPLVAPAPIPPKPAVPVPVPAPTPAPAPAVPPKPTASVPTPPPSASPAPPAPPALMPPSKVAPPTPPASRTGPPPPPPKPAAANPVAPPAVTATTPTPPTPTPPPPPSAIRAPPPPPAPPAPPSSGTTTPPPPPPGGAAVTGSTPSSPSPSSPLLCNPPTGTGLVFKPDSISGGLVSTFTVKTSSLSGKVMYKIKAKNPDMFIASPPLGVVSAEMGEGSSQLVTLRVPAAHRAAFETEFKDTGAGAVKVRGMNVPIIIQRYVIPNDKLSTVDAALGSGANASAALKDIWKLQEAEDKSSIGTEKYGAVTG